MGDFLRLLESELEGFRDAVFAIHRHQLDALHEEIRSLRLQLSEHSAKSAGRGPVLQPKALAEVDKGNSSFPTPTLKAAAAVDQQQSCHERDNYWVEQRECNSDANPPTHQYKSGTALGMTHRNRFALRDFWTSKYSLLQNNAVVVTPQPRISESETRFHTRHKSNTFPLTHLAAKDTSWYVVDPNSAIAMLWRWISLAFLTYDLLYIPWDLAFNLQTLAWIEMTSWIARVFWTLDLLLSFVTGVYINGRKEMGCRKIAMRYVRTWLPLDLTILAADWIMGFLSSSNPGSRPLSMMRFVRFARLIRLLRFGKLKKTCSDVGDSLSPELPKYIASVSRSLQITLYFAIALHLLSCMWYGIGQTSGVHWVAFPHTSDDVWSRYIFSLHWTLTLVHELSDAYLQSTAERGLACASIFFTLLLYSLLVAKTTYEVFSLQDSQAAKMLAISKRFTKNRQVSAPLKARIHKYLRAQHAEGIIDEQVGENSMIESLPESLQVDIHAEVRLPLLVSMRFFEDMQMYNSRVLRQICHVATNEVFILDGDVVFAPGDSCTRMIFVARGLLTYLPGRREQIELRFDKHVSSLSSHTSQRSGPPGTPLARGKYLCEPALWTTWEHKGDLVATHDSILLVLDAERFEEAVRHHVSACVHALKYARHFVWHLNHHRGPMNSDILNVSLSLKTLDDELFSGSEDVHFMFISHFKQEAGTEAALMAVDLERMIREDPTNAASEFMHPVFLDSENLRDLAELTSHVQKSHYLLLLLTPAVLSRPWCLVELVHAVRHGVGIVPVQVNRPGTSFEFPTEAFYRKVLAGDLLKQDAIDLLHAQGIVLDELVQCMRLAFQKISFTFSPQKSWTIRQAELAEIVKACEPATWSQLPGMVGAPSEG